MENSGEVGWNYRWKINNVFRSRNSFKHFRKINCESGRFITKKMLAE